jgi:hypothetical protein
MYGPWLASTLSIHLNTFSSIFPETFSCCLKLFFNHRSTPWSHLLWAPSLRPLTGYRRNTPFRPLALSIPATYPLCWNHREVLSFPCIDFNGGASPLLRRSLPVAPSPPSLASPLHPLARPAAMACHNHSRLPNRGESLAIAAILHRKEMLVW